jgi:hypothetical protein
MSAEEVRIAIENLEFSKQEFAANLDVARAIWQRYPDLVEAPKFPVQFLQSFQSREHKEPGNPDACYWDSELVATGILVQKPAQSQN